MEAKTLALYLGCECTESGLSSRGNTLVEVAFDGYEESSVRTPQGSVLSIRTTKIKPIIRPLSEITQEEKLDCPKLSVDKWGNVTVESMAKLVNYLRSIGIDCDGLIEKGEAIDATKETIYTP